MASKIKSVFLSLFARRLTRQVRELYTATLILDFAVAMVAIFEPVFLYVYFIKFYDLKVTLEFILLFYLVIYIPYFLVVPLGAKFAKRFGYENSIAVSSIFNILIYLGLFSMNQSFWFIFLAASAYVFAKAFYWPAYHSNFARFSSDGEQGREISNLLAMQSLIFILAPFLGGLILQFYGFKVLFIIVSILILISNIPMLITKEKFEPKGFSYFDAYKRIFSRKHLKGFIAHWAYGEELIALVIWPVFMFVVVKDFLNLGFLSAVSTLLTTAIFLFIGKMADDSSDRSILRFGTVFYFFSWLAKILTRGIFGVLLLDVYSRVAKQAISIPVTTKTYERAQDESVMKTIVFFEMSLVVGKIIAMILSLFLLQIFVPGWNSLFILGALFTLFYLLF